MTTKNLNVEYEATFCDINIDEIRKKIKNLNGKLLKPMFNQKRTVLNFPKGHEIRGGWLRVRDESDKITMTLKIMESNGSIEGQKEIELIVNSYENAVNLLRTIGAEEKAVQETKRELWELDGVELMIDLWPFLEPVIEIEGKNEADVKKVAEKLGILSIIYTNGTMINKKSAERLFRLKTSIVLKYNSFNNKIQDKLVGVKGYDKRVKKALKILMDLGFNKGFPLRLAIDCIATKINKKDVIPLFKFCRENNISPQFSGLIPHGEALERGLVLNKKEYTKIYNEAKTYDNEKGLKYPYQLPFLGGFQCRQIKYGLYIDVLGDVWECNAGELHLGNIRESKLKRLWLSKKAKNFRRNWNCGNCHIREKYWKKQNDKRKS